MTTTHTLNAYVLIPDQGAEEYDIEAHAWNAMFELASQQGISGKTSELRRAGPDFYQLTLRDEGRVIRGTFRQYQVDVEVEDARSMGGQ